MDGNHTTQQSILDRDMDMFSTSNLGHRNVGSPALTPNTVTGMSSIGNSTTSKMSTPAQQKVASTSTQKDLPVKILTKSRLQELVKEIDPTEQLDDEVEDVLLQIADEFVENTVKAACALAKHRKSNTVDVKDVQLYLERTWNMWIPGFGTDELRPYRRSNVTEAHRQRMALIRKTLKKY